MRLRLAFVAMVVAFGCTVGWAEDVVSPASNDDEPGGKEGVRPYEMDWANRLAPVHPVLVDFEDLTGWRVRCSEGADAKLYRSEEEKLFGEYTGKVVYSGATGASRFVMEAAEAIAIPEPFTAVDLWVRGNNWGWIDPPATARVGVRALVRDAKNEVYRIDLGVVDFDYWFLLHATCVSPDGKTKLYEPLGTPNDGVIDFPASFVGLEISGCASKVPAKLFFDALSFYTMEYPALSYAPGPPELPWPTTPDTILPTCKPSVRSSMVSGLATGRWAVDATDGADVIRFAYTPSDGTLGDVTVDARGQQFQPCWKGGIAFQVGGREVRPGDAGVQVALAESRDDGEGCVAVWRLTADGQTFEYQYAFHVRGQSLVVDVTSRTADATQFDVGLMRGKRTPATVFIPYLTYGDDWPKVVCSPGEQGPLFLLSLLDYYNSDASELFGAPRLHDDGATGYAGGASYRPTTAGTRNPLRERLFVNVSQDVQEVLPNIPNPDSDMREVAREYLWRNIGSLFQNEMLLKYKGYGIDKFIACHHEVGWREGGESFTQRDRPAPSLGDEQLKAYAAFVRDLGYRFGTYTNYVDFAPVNANWNENDVCLNGDGSWQKAWPRCYAFKPSRAPEREADYANRINERYGTTAQYCDVMTAYTPWGRTDYDARTPGAGMFRTQYNAFARLLQNESLAHKGPVFSEGNYHWFYAGIVDGDYATIVPYGRGWQMPQLVDFDLLKMHPKMTDFGVGMPQMYFGSGGAWTNDHSRLSPFYDRFHTATIAFGHIGFLADDWGFDGTLKSYYLLQALQQRYVPVPVRSIQYFDGTALVDTSAAIADGGYKRQQVRAEYENGLVTWCNLSFTDDWKVEVNGVSYLLPPGGFVAFKPDDILAYSATVDGVRHELVWCRDYLYVDTRGELVRTPVITTRGTVVVKPDGANAWWIIPATRCEETTVARAWLQVGDAVRLSATACRLDGSPVGPARLLTGADAVTVVPSADESVVKYRLTAEPAQASAITALHLASRMVLTTNSVSTTVTVRVSPDANATGLALAWTCGRPGAEPLKTDKVDLVLSEDKQTASATFDLFMPAGAPMHQRCWYRFQPSWLGEEEARWEDVVALPAFDLTLPLGTFQIAAHKPFDMGANVLSHLPGTVTASFRLEADGILERPLGRQVMVKSEEVQPLIWRIQLPDLPAAVRLRMTAEGAGHSVDYIRYMRTRPTTWVVADLVHLPMTRGAGLRGVGEIPYDAAVTGGVVDPARDGLGGQTLDTIFTHPPYKTGVGYVTATFADVALPPGHPKLTFSMGFRPGSTTHDGCTFRALVADQGKETEVFSEQYATLDAWAPRSADLSVYAGRTVSIKLLTDVGPNDDSQSDWAVWGAPRVVMAEPAWKVELRADETALAFGPSPKPLGKLKSAELEHAKEAHITLDTAGVNGGPNASPMWFNGAPIGMTPESGSDTEWRAASIPLPADAVASMRRVNTLVIRNPGGDFMKVRNVCLHFELADGRQGASLVELGPYCTANTWEFAEGTSVTLGDDLPEMVLSIP